MSLAKPHEAFGLSKPFFCRLPKGIVALNMLLMGLILLLGLVYVVQVNGATSSGYALRAAERKVEALKTETMIMHDKIATMSSIQAVSTRASELGFVPVDRLEFMNPAGNSYARR